MSKEYNSDWNLQRLTLPIEIEGTTVYRPYPSGDLLICVDDNEGTSHASLKDLQLYEKQRRLISCESLIGCLIEILYNQSEWRLALVLSYDPNTSVHIIQFILRNASVMIPPTSSSSFSSSTNNVTNQDDSTRSNSNPTLQQQYNSNINNNSNSNRPSSPTSSNTSHITTLSDLNLDSIPTHHYSTRKASVQLHKETFYVKTLSDNETKRMAGLNEWKERRLEYPHWNDQLPSQYTLQAPPPCLPQANAVSSCRLSTHRNNDNDNNSTGVLFKDLSSSSSMCDSAYYLAASMVHFAYCPTSASDEHSHNSHRYHNILLSTANHSNVNGGTTASSYSSGSNHSSNDTDNNNRANDNNDNANSPSSSNDNNNSNGYVDNIGQKRGSLEQGHQLKGHRMLRTADSSIANKCKSSLLYGEFTPRGLNKALDENHLKAHYSCRVMYDMGMGVGKAAMQAFLQCTNMEKVVGIELTAGRYSIAAEAALQLCKQHPEYFNVRHYNPGVRCVISATEEYESLLRSLTSSSSSSSSSQSNMINSTKRIRHPRKYELRCQDMYTCARELQDVDVLLLMTDITKEKRRDCIKMLYSLPIGARVLTYDNFHNLTTDKPNKILGGSSWFSSLTSSPASTSGGSGSSILGSSWKSFSRLLSSRQHKQQRVVSNSYGDDSNHHCHNNHTADIMNTPFIQVDVNKAVSDRFSATWSLNRGHHLFIYQRSISPETAITDVTDRLQIPQSYCHMYNDDIYNDDINNYNNNDNDNSRGDEKSETDTEIDNDNSDLSHDFQTTTAAANIRTGSSYSSSSSSSSSSSYHDSRDDNDQTKGKNDTTFVAVKSKRPSQTQSSMFVSLFRLFPSSLLPFKAASTGTGHNGSRNNTSSLYGGYGARK